MEVREWFERQEDKGKYLKDLIINDKIQHMKMENNGGE